MYFTHKLVVSKVGEYVWMVEEPFRFYIDDTIPSNFVDVDAGFITDFASVPRIFWAVVPPDGSYTQAAVLHDKLYQSQERPRKEADQIFLWAMDVLDVPAWQKYLIYASVRLFGGFAWREYLRLSNR